VPFEGKLIINNLHNQMQHLCIGILVFAPTSLIKVGLPLCPGCGCVTLGLTLLNHIVNRITFVGYIGHNQSSDFKDKQILYRVGDIFF